jgi:hypothetical protein
MSPTTPRRFGPGTIATGALALGLLARGYGIASAADGSGSTTTASPSPTARTLPALGQSGNGSQHGWDSSAATSRS